MREGLFAGPLTPIFEKYLQDPCFTVHVQVTPTLLEPHFLCQQTCGMWIRAISFHEHRDAHHTHTFMSTFVGFVVCSDLHFSPSFPELSVGRNFLTHEPAVSR